MEIFPKLNVGCPRPSRPEALKMTRHGFEGSFSLFGGDLSSPMHRVEPEFLVPYHLFGALPLQQGLGTRGLPEQHHYTLFPVPSYLICISISKSRE